MKYSSRFRGFGAQLAVAAVAWCLAAPGAWALGLGRVAVQSSLGEALRAEIEVTSLVPDEANSLRVRIATPETYRLSGVEYNTVLPSIRAVLESRGEGRSFLRLASDRVVQEPFVNLILELSWNTGRLVRDYTLLFDPPTARALAASPAQAEPRAASPLPDERAAAPLPPRAREPAPRPPPPKAEPTALAAVSAAAAPENYRVKSGDTLSGIAGRVQPQGVSLDQMLVALFNSNAQAFVDKNMNRLRAGVTLAIPDADAARAVAPAQARQFVQAQSADFAAYRQRLAGAAAAAAPEAAPRQATGTVQATVEDRKQALATKTAPDKLTLSKAGVTAALPEEALSKELEAKDAAARAAELKKNVDDLAKLAAAAKPASAAASAPEAAAASAVAAAPASAAASAPVAVAAASAASAATKPVAKPVPSPAAADEPGLLAELLGTPWVLAACGMVLALLAGLGVYRSHRRKGAAQGQASFFGASGGQLVDTSEAPASPSSSMSYSLSQIDAKGAVDPVAEADVYLAYGRDLQAEEILKEALRSDPGRMAIRTKLLEVYVKRRDAKGFEVLAQQMFDRTEGEGEHWARAQELGRQIDAGNPLYQPGGRPLLPDADDDRGQRLGPPTVPMSMPQTPTQPPDDATIALPAAPTPLKFDFDLDLDLDLDHLDLDLSLDQAADANPVPTAPEVAPAAGQQLQDLAFELPAEPPQAPFVPGPPASLSDMGIDLSGLALDFTTPTVPDFQLGGSAANELLDAAEDAIDPFARKIELAEEFRQIGDLEGARDLLQEVISKASGAVQAKARAMLERLG